MQAAHALHARNACRSRPAHAPAPPRRRLPTPSRSCGTAAAAGAAWGAWSRGAAAAACCCWCRPPPCHGRLLLLPLLPLRGPQTMPCRPPHGLAGARPTAAAAAPLLLLLLLRPRPCRLPCPPAAALPTAACAQTRRPR
jgi:hypothetical protein